MTNERSWTDTPRKESSRRAMSDAFDYLGRISTSDLAELQQACNTRVNQGNQTTNQRGQK